MYINIILPHFPKHIGGLLNINDDNQLILIDEETQKMYECTIDIDTRNESIKNIGKGWYEYMRLKKYVVGLVIMCNFEIDTRRLYVCLAEWL